MALPPGTRLGPYEIQSPIGAGGMGEVYRARDTRLGRDAAIKILPEAFAVNAERLARFEREARLLASLNHPNIATIYGVEEAGGVRAIALELIEGEDLSDRLRRGRLPLPEALAIARQIVDALDAAHERGVIHRDLKPGNVRITPDGVVKILDFGLARPSTDADQADLSHSPTTVGPTEDGTLLGTAPYMSPEQARGKPVDKRTDIWAFGCVLFEMLSGRRAFQGDTTSDTIAAILRSEPEWPALATTPAIERLTRRCLEKDLKQRLRDIGDARPELHAAIAPAATTSRRAWIGIVAAAIAGVVVTAGVMGRVTPPPDLGRGATVTRLTSDSGASVFPALTPDGTLLAYASTRSGRADFDIWVQQMSGVTPLRLTDDAADDVAPDLSPDGSRVVFRSERQTSGAYLAPSLGGPARLIAPGARDPKFSPDGQSIAYWTGQFRGAAVTTESSVFILPLAGGTPVRLMPDFVVARNPVWSPDGKALLVLAQRSRATTQSTDIDFWLAPIDGRPPTRTTILDRAAWRSLVELERTSAGSWNSAGFLFAIDGTLWSLVLDPASGRPTTEPRTLMFGAGLVSRPAASRDGTIVFSQSHTERVIETAPLSATGAEPSPPTRNYADGERIARRASGSADGRTILFERESAKSKEIWTKHVPTGVLTLIMTLETRSPLNPVIATDGRRFAYTVDDDANPDKSRAYVANVAGGLPKQICDGCAAWGLVAGGERALVVAEQSRAIQSIDLATGRTTTLIRVTEGRVDRPAMSPNERWLAFRHTAGTTAKTFLLPAAGGDLRSAAQIEEPTTTGRPCGWSPDSRLLMLFLDTDGSRCLWGQPVDAVTGRPAGTPVVVRHLHELGLGGASTSFGNAITADGLLFETLARQASLWLLTPGSAANAR